MNSAADSSIERENLKNYMRKMDSQNLLFQADRSGDLNAMTTAIIDDNMNDFVKLLYLIHVEKDKK
jgi:hypothetical protein